MKNSISPILEKKEFNRRPKTDRQRINKEDRNFQGH